MIMDAELEAARQWMTEAKGHKVAARYADAERCCRKALEIHERLLGSEHPET